MTAFDLLPEPDRSLLISHLIEAVPLEIEGVDRRAMAFAGSHEVLELWQRRGASVRCDGGDERSKLRDHRIPETSRLALRSGGACRRRGRGCECCL